MAPYVVAIAHPSLQMLVDPFVDGLRAETRRFKSPGGSDPKPSSQITDKLADRRSRRFGVIENETLIGIASLSHDGEVSIAVAAEHRGRGVGTMLLRHLIERATLLGHQRLVMEPNRRSAPVAALTERLGWVGFDMGGGRVELILELDQRHIGAG